MLGAFVIVLIDSVWSVCFVLSYFALKQTVFLALSEEDGLLSSRIPCQLIPPADVPVTYTQGTPHIAASLSIEPCGSRESVGHERLKRLL